MTSQPDKFFREKLENFQQLAPAGAWDRIENNLAKPVHKLVWVRVAAGVALLATASLVWWPFGKTETAIANTKDNTSVKKNTPQTAPVQHEVKEDTEEQKTEQARTQQFINNSSRTKNQSIETTIATDKDSAFINSIPETPELIAEVLQPEEKESTSKTIVYTTEEVNAKFLKKKLPPQATPANQDASGIQKLIGLAYDAKNSEAPLGSLRQKKDDILALNFGKKKGEN